jgi:hypothetical protein
MQRIRRQQPKPRRSIFDSGDGIDFVRCRICGKHLRLITGTHLATHGTDRETYMQDTASARTNSAPSSSAEIIVPAVTTVRTASSSGLSPSRLFTNGTGRFLLAICRSTIQISIEKAFGYSVIGTQLSVQPDSRLRKCGCGGFGMTQGL